MPPCIATLIDELLNSAAHCLRAGDESGKLAFRAAAQRLQELTTPPAEGSPPVPQLNRYCLGFAFNDGDVYSGPHRHVALIRKLKPEWQKGLLNGIGGKLEEGEPGHFGMVREFQEETGWESLPEDWTYFAQMRGNDFAVFCFVSSWNINELHALESKEEEKVEIHPVSQVLGYQENVVGNLFWLIPLALDCLLSKPTAPCAVIAKY